MEPRSRILIIDDEEIVLDSCVHILKGDPYDVATARDGTAGLKLVGEFRPGLVFLDLKMPGVSGFDVLERIGRHDPTIVNVVITGYATVSSAVDAMKKGAYDFLPKPFTPDEFRVITRRALEKRKLLLETIALKKEKEMLRDNFAALVSHELKAPLSAVQQNLFVLEAELSGKLTDAEKNRLERIRLRLDDLLKLIHTWLRVISVDIQRLAESFRPVSVISSIATAIEGLQQQAARKDIRLATSGGEALKLVQGDAGTLTEAFVNLIGNAIKYSRPGGAVSIAAENQGANVVISVSDQGVGIAGEDLPFIFNEFYTGKSAQPAERGCGLGLAITRRIIEAHQGSITVDSGLGKGSTFVITLPAWKEEASREPVTSRGVLTDSPQGGPV